MADGYLSLLFDISKNKHFIKNLTTDIIVTSKIVIDKPK